MQHFTRLCPGRGHFAARLLSGLLFLAILLALPQTGRAQAPAWAWARNQVMTAQVAGGSSLITPRRVGVDGSGNSYVFGNFGGILTLGAFSLNNAGGADLYVAKYDPSGTCLWARNFGGLGVEFA